jgi:ubiquinone/menaquinone biosynthesis C-methylase UbiE
VTVSPEAEVSRGAAVYNDLTLAAYDHVVLAFSCSVIWRCKRRYLADLYRRHAGSTHLDLGVGTGALIAEAAPPRGTSITLADLNPASLSKAASTLRAYEPRAVVANALDPMPFEPGTFDSAAANFLLHCVPGSIAEKGIILKNLAACVRPGGTVFGSTILAHGVPVTRPARRLMAYYNGKGIFHNAADSLEDLRRTLDDITPHYSLTTQGSVALFHATLP